MTLDDLVQTPASEPLTQVPPDQKKPYWEILNQYRQYSAQNPDIPMSMPEFAQHSNEATGTNAFDEGANDSTLRRAGANISIGLHKFGQTEPLIPGLPSTTVPGLSEMFGGPKEGIDLPEKASAGASGLATQMGASPTVASAVGEGASGLVESAPAAVAGLLPGVGIPAMATVAGLQTYGETGRTLPSLISGATTALIPKFMQKGGQVAARLAGAPLANVVAPELASLSTPSVAAEVGSRFVPSNLVQRGAEFAGKQLGLTANMEVGQAGQTLTDPNLSWQDKVAQIGQQFSPSSLMATGIGQLPFTALDLVHARTKPIDILRSEVGQDFAQRYTDAAAKGDPETGSPGFVPTNGQIAEAADRLMRGEVPKPSVMYVSPTGEVHPEPEKDPVGQVLKSMGLEPPEAQPLIKTKEGDWAPGLAIEATRDATNNALYQRGMSTAPIGAEHSATLDAIVRGVERSAEGPLSRDEFVRRTTVRMIDLYDKYKENLNQLGTLPEHLQGKEFPPKFEAIMDAKIAGAVTPGSPTYNKDVHQRIALVEGDQEHWAEAGLGPVTTTALGEAFKALNEVDPNLPPLEVTRRGEATSQLQNNIINMWSRLPPKPTLGEEVQSHQQAAKVLDERIKQLTAQGAEGLEVTDPLETEEVGRLVGLRDKHIKLAEQLSNKETWERGDETPLDSSTAAARRLAYNYGNLASTPTLDVNDPKSVAKFVRDIFHTMSQAETDWLREREGGATIVEKHPTLENALAAVDKFEAAKDQKSQETGYFYKYRVPRARDPLTRKMDYAKNPDGSFNVVEQKYRSTQGGLGGETEGQSELTAEASTRQERVLKDLQELPEELFSQRFKDLGNLSDPAEGEARKAAMAQNIVNFVNGISDTHLKQLIQDRTGVGMKNPARLKAQFISYVRFLQIGGRIDTFKDKDGHLKATKGSDVDGLNAFMGPEIGHGVYPAGHGHAGEQRGDRFNESHAAKRGGMTFFDQFAVLANEIQKYQQDPRSMKADPESMPSGNLAFVPQGVANDIDKALTYNRVEHVTDQRSGFAKMGEFTEDGPEGEGVVKLTDPKTGDERRFLVPYNPIETFFVKSTVHGLTGKAGDLADMFLKYVPDADPAHRVALQTMLQHMPYLRDMPVGARPTIDPNVKGYAHNDYATSGAGMLLNPYEPDPSHMNPFRLMTPKEILPHFIDELGHGSTMFAYNMYPEFKASVDETFKYVKDYVESMKQFAGSDYASGTDHALSRPEEMLAAVFHNADLHKVLKKIDDPGNLTPLLRTERTGSMFDRLMTMLRDLFSRLFGDETAGTMLNRVAELSTRGVELQKGLPVNWAGDIYQFLYNKGLVGTVIHALGPQPVPKPVEPTQTYPHFTTEPVWQGKPGGPMETKEQQADPVRYMLWEDVQHQKDQLAYTKWNGAVSAPPFYTPERTLPSGEIESAEELRARSRPRFGMHDTPAVIQRRLTEAEQRLAQYDVGTLPVEQTFKDRVVRDRESALADWQTRLTEYQALPDTNPNKPRLVEQATNQIALNQALIPVLRRFVEAPEGTVLQSRESYEKELPKEKYTGPTQPVKDGTYHIEGKNFFLGKLPEQGYGTVLKLKDGRYLSTFNRSFHGELVTVLDHLKISDQDIVDAGFVQDGKFRSGGDLAENLEPAKLEMATETDPEFWWRSKVGALDRDEKRLRGQVLESRANPQAVLDAMRSSSNYPVEDAEKFWFKPYELTKFRDMFGPAFGDKLRLTQRAGQWGYEVPRDALNRVTTDDLSRMPQPQIKPYTYSLFDALTSRAKEQGSDDATSNAVASYAVSRAALLRNTDQLLWTRSVNDVGNLLGFAYDNHPIVGLTPQGMAQDVPEMVKTIQHEAGHKTLDSPDVVASVERLNSTFDSLSPDERASFISGLNGLVDEGLGIDPQALVNPDEFAATFIGRIGDMLGNVPKPSAYLRDTMRFAPDEVSDLLLKDTLRRMQGIDLVRALVKQTAAMRGTDPQKLSSALDVMWDTFKGLTRPALEIAQDQTDFQHMRLLFPDTYQELLDQLQNQVAVSQTDQGFTATPAEGQVLESRLSNDIRKFFRLPTPDGRLPDKLNFWDKMLMQLSQFANKYPIARPHSDMLRTSAGMERWSRIRLTTALAGTFQGNKIIDDVRTKHVAQFWSNPRLQEQFSKIGLDLQETGDKAFDKERALKQDVFQMDPNAVTGWKTPQYVEDLMNKYGVADKDKPIMRTVLEGVQKQMREVGDNVVASHVHALGMLVGNAVSRNTDLSAVQSREVGAALVTAFDTVSKDPQKAQGMIQQFQAVVNDPEVFGKIFDMTSAGWTKIQELKTFLDLRQPYFMSERRGGGFGLLWKDATDKVQSRYWGTSKERENYLRANPTIDPIRQINPQDRDYGVPQQVFNILNETQQRFAEKVVGVFGQQDADKLSSLLDFSTDLRDALNSRDILKLTTGRDLAPGREDLNMFQTQQHYLNATNNAIKNRFIKLESELLLTDPSFANQPFISDYLDKQVKAVITPDSPLGQKIQQLSFLYYLWGNPSSMIMQTSHQVMGLAPTLTSLGSSLAGSFNTIKNANQMLIQGGLKGRFKNPVFQEMMSRADKLGDTSSWIAQDIDHLSDLSMVNRMRATTGQGLWQPFDLLKNKLYQGYSLVRRFYDMVPIYNSKVAMLASLMHLTSDAYVKYSGKRLSGDELYNEAVHLKNITMFPGGKGNRPGFFQYLPRSAAQSLWSLQTYANGLTTMMGELIRKSVNPQGAGLTPAQGRQVRKAAAQMLITQTAVAGVLGLPFAQAALYGLQKLFPESNPEEWVNDALASMFGDDKATGHLFSSAVTLGVPSILDYGPDLGSRFALAGTFHVSPYSGVGWEQLVGPAGGVVTKMAQGLQAGARGDPLGTVESMMPNGFQRIWKTLEQGNTYQSENGQMVVDNLRPTEIAARIIGFRPARIARIEEFQRLERVSEDAEKATQTNWTKQQVDLLKQNRDAEVQQNIAQRVEKTKGLYPAPRLANDVAREYEKSTTPVDLRKYGNRATILQQQALHGRLGQQDEGPSNMDRMMIQSQIAQRLGLGGPSRGQFRHAGNIDGLLQMYPNLTTAQADVLLSHAAASRPSPALYEELLRGGAP